jgi:hypothetical protein
VEAHGGLTEYNGRPGVLGSLLDVTERKRAEEQMRGMQRFNIFIKRFLMS